MIRPERRRRGDHRTTEGTTGGTIGWPGWRGLAVAGLTGTLAVAASAGEYECGEACRHGKLELFAESALAAFDPATGREHRSYAPDRLVDHLHMTLRMRFESLDGARFTATETLRMRGLGLPVETLRLDAVGLTIDDVRRDGRETAFAVDDESLTVRFDPPLQPGEETAVEIDYECRDPINGMTFSPAVPALGIGPQIHTQGQPDRNRHWFPCHDFPNERLATELIVDVPAAYAVSANGRLVEHRVDGDRAIWHWLQDRPHVNYLVSLVIGEFDRVDLPAPSSGLPMTVWVPPGKGGDVLRTYGRTGAMVDLFERRFGMPYPWARYDQLVVRNFGAGGMENTSATSMYPTAVFDQTALLDGDLDGLIAHELAHQWFGDLITCRSWAHIWLNEGWATYGESLWFEERDGIDGYLDDTRSNFRRVARRDRTSGTVGMVSPIYASPSDTFRRAANPYPKGASILHMLRCMLGDEVFFTGVRAYLERHADGVAETVDFRHVMEEVSGRELEWFFQQWAYRPGIPELTVKAAYDAARGEVVVDLEQTQQIDERTPAFRFELPVHVMTDAGTEVITVGVRERVTSHRARVEGVPSMIVVDPELHVLASMELDLPERMLLEQADRGPTVAARRAAIDALGDRDRPETVELMTLVALDGTRRHTEREDAVRALAGYGSAMDAVRLLVEARIEDARVREAVLVAAGKLPDEEAIEIYAAAAADDPSYDCRVTAVRGLGRLEAEDHADLVLDLVDFPSQHAKVRNAALAALADLDDPRGLEAAMRCATLGNPDRARPRAIVTVGRLSHHDEDQALEMLVELLQDKESRSVIAAGEALAAIGDERAIEPLQRMAGSHPSDRMKERARGWIETIQDAG